MKYGFHNVIALLFLLFALSNCRDAEIAETEYPIVITKQADILEDASLYLEAEILNYEEINELEEYGFEISNSTDTTILKIGQNNTVQTFNYQLRSILEKDNNYSARAYSKYNQLKVVGPPLSFKSLGSSNVTITSPENLSSLPSGEPVIFDIQVTSDILEDFEDTKVELVSDVDGLLAEGVPNENGKLSLTIPTISPEVHLMKAVFMDDKGFIGADSIQLSSTITLKSLDNSTGNVTIEWSEINNSEFRNYEIFRVVNGVNETSIKQISNSEITSFTDFYPPLTDSIEYFVRMNLVNGKSFDSNTLISFQTSGPLFYFYPNTVIPHPTEPYLYVIKKGYETSEIIKFNFDKREIEEHIVINDEIRFGTFGNNGKGDELYLPGNSSIHILTADKLDYVAELETGLRTISVVSSNNGFLIASLYNGPSVDLPVRTYSRNNLSFISGNGDWGGDRLRFNHSRMEAISITTSISPYDMEFFAFSDEGEIISHVDDKGHGNPLDPYIFKISDNGEYSITSKKGYLYATSSDMHFIGQLEGENFRDFSFSEDGKTIFAAVGQKVCVYEYNSLSKFKEIRTKGIPFFIERRGDKIVAVSQSTINSDLFGVELVYIE